MSAIEALSSVRIFSGLDPGALEAIAGVASEVSFEPGQVIIEARAAGTGMFVILEGRVAVHARGVDTELGPGEAIGELALFRADSRRIARVQAQTPVRALAIDRNDFRRLVGSDVKLAVGLLENLADRVPD